MSLRIKKDKKDKDKKSTTSSPSTNSRTDTPSDTPQPATRSWKKKLEENENQKTLKCVNHHCVLR
jgi:hypothetical protein